MELYIRIIHTTVFKSWLKVAEVIDWNLNLLSYILVASKLHLLFSFRYKIDDLKVNWQKLKIYWLKKGLKQL